MSSKLLKVIFLFLFLLTLFTRFFKLNWGSNYYFHPDENNMANAVLQMDRQNLNPNFFAYGQFPLYLTYFTTPHHDFSTIVLTLRFWSAFFSSISVLFFYLIVSQFFKNKKTILASTLLFILIPGLIQSAHFGTTESLLLLTFLINIFVSLKLLKKYNSKYLFLLSLISGIALATKISAFLLLTPIFLSLFFIHLKNPNLLTLIKRSFIFIILTLLISFIFSPYNILDFNSFLSSVAYEIKIANGQNLVFYTRQFLNTYPYLFQFQKIFPYTISLPILLLSLLGIFYLPKKSKKLFIVMIPVLVFFLYQGQLFVKWTRFMVPIFFIFPFLSAFFINQIKNKIVLSLVILISIIPAFLFFNIYLNQDIRIQASQWLINNLQKESIILSESGNVVDLPIYQHNFKVNNFNFYQLENSSQSENKLEQTLENNDYIIIPSRRVFKNHHSPNFPKTENYYQNLFSQKLPFTEIKKFTLPTTLFLDSENAEETWSVFDNPTIRIYQRNNVN